MTTMRNTLFGQIALGVTLTCMGAAAFAASNPNTYLNGTYMVGGFDSDPADFQLFVTFDGAGNGSATEIRNSGGETTTGTNSGTYTVASNGTFTLNTGTNTLTGGISADGNTLLLTQLGSGQNPEFDVAIKQGLISNFNVASGLVALASDKTGANNTAFGYAALYSNTSGRGNAAQGANALSSNISGIRNLGIGNNALIGNVSGSYNIALGFNAGTNVTTGSNNIEIGAPGTASDNGTIQIGSQGTQTSTTIAGIYGTLVSGSAVYVTSTGQLGTLVSSERYKTDIATMPALSGKLAQLRPVTFHYRTDPKSVQQYGLIAEEVDKGYQALVIRDGSGKIQGVHYEELAPMLLGEVQALQQKVQTAAAKTAAQVRMSAVQAQKIDGQAAEIRELKLQFAQLKDLNEATQAALRQMLDR